VIINLNLKKNNVYDKLLLLDRDGVVLKSVIRDENPNGSARNVNEMEYFENINKNLELISQQNVAIIVVTNQPDINRGIILENEILSMNEKLIEDLPIEGVICCPHAPEENCLCRKPNTLMLEYAKNAIMPKKKKVLMVGDRLSDVQAGTRADMDVIHLKQECNECSPQVKHFVSLDESNEYIMDKFINKKLND
jgi:D-glycero-D-manno-heptose 1,7-bisphosphate phosphatase